MASETSTNTRLGPEKSLPYPDIYTSSEDYVEKLLDFVGSNALFQTLCGGVHVLDFFTSTPDLYTQLLPEEWRDFFRDHEIMDILDLLMREDLSDVPVGDAQGDRWREGPCPPSSLRDHIQSIRDHSLIRTPSTSQCHRNRAMKPTQKLARHVAVGMNVKKVHEVGLFTSYVSDLSSSISSNSSSSSGHERKISHLVDFGSGQNYLGRALASKPYDMNIVAIESKGHNQDRALQLDVRAKLRAKDVVYRNKKLFRAGYEKEAREHEVEGAQKTSANGLPTPPSESEVPKEACEDDACAEPDDTVGAATKQPKANIQLSAEGDGTIQYVEEWVENGDLTNVINRIVDPSVAKEKAADTAPEATAGFKQIDIPLSDASVSDSQTTPQSTDKNLMVISLHSCGNLLHHALHSLTSNSQVRAVCLVGCCYNLLTERLAPATYKHPALRPAATPRLERESTRGDPNGFPMSNRLCSLATIEDRPGSEHATGVRLNITARMMAVQAPQNWTAKDSDAFFSRHFYRALLQRIFLDKGIVSPPSPTSPSANVSPLGHDSGTPIIIGSLRKACYASFPAYVRGALAKLYACEFRGALFRERMGPDVLSDAELEDYERRFWAKKKELSVVWSLMAFSAGVVESLILVDRWLWLKEQEEVKEAWVEPVFEYRMSPRNLVVVGLKK